MIGLFVYLFVCVLWHISIEGYLMPNLFLYKYTVLFKKKKNKTV